MRTAAVRSVVASVLDRAQAAPRSLALIDRGRPIDYGTFARDVLGVAAQLHGSGVRDGETVALAFEQRPDLSYRYACLFYALDYLGAILLPLHSEVPRARHSELVAAWKAKLLDPGRFGDGESAAPAVPSPHADDPGREFLVRFTSGTTGNPKAVLFTNAQLAANVAACAAALDTSGADRLVSSRAWPDLVALRHMLWIHSAGGVFVNVSLPMSGTGIRDAIDALGITQLMLSPAQLRVLIAEPPRAGILFESLRVLFSGGAAMTRAEIAAIRGRLSPRLQFAYGANETGLIGVLRPEDPVEAGALLLPGIEAEAVDERDERLPHGQLGRLRFRAPWFPQAYAGNPDATRQRFCGGWFYPGDLGSVDAAGRIDLRGRDDEVVNCSGIKILPRDVEAVILGHPGVADVPSSGSLIRMPAAPRSPSSCSSRASRGTSWRSSAASGWTRRAFRTLSWSWMRCRAAPTASSAGRPSSG